MDEILPVDTTLRCFGLVDIVVVAFVVVIVGITICLLELDEQQEMLSSVSYPLMDDPMDAWRKCSTMVGGRGVFI